MNHTIPRALFPFAMLPLLACGEADVPAEAEDTATSESAMTARSNLGPSLAYYDAPSGRSDWVFLFFKGHNNDYVWNAKGHYTWPTAEIVRDNRSPESFAFSNREPASLVYTLPAITHGMAPRTAKHHVYLAFAGHNNDQVWHTRREIHEAYASQYLGDWATPQTIPGAHSNHAPAVAVHDWYDSPTNKMFTVAWTALDGTIKVKRAHETTFPADHAWPFDYGDETGLPSSYKSAAGPAMLSVGSDLHVFFRGQGTDYRLFHATWSGSSWNVQTIPSAYSQLAPSVTLHDGDIYMAFAGHNNRYIWLRHHDRTTGTWRSLGYVAGLETSQRPSLVSTGSQLKLAFRGAAHNDTCVGSLYVDPTNGPGTAGHTWYHNSGTQCTTP